MSLPPPTHYHLLIHKQSCSCCHSLNTFYSAFTVHPQRSGTTFVPTTAFQYRLPITRETVTAPATPFCSACAPEALEAHLNTLPPPPIPDRILSCHQGEPPSLKPIRPRTPRSPRTPLPTSSLANLL